MKNSEILSEFPKIHPVYRGDLDGRSVHFEDADVDDWQLIGKGGERLTCFSPLFPEGCGARSTTSITSEKRA